MKNREDNVKQLENKAKQWNHPQLSLPAENILTPVIKNSHIYTQLLCYYIKKTDHQTK